MLRRVTPALFAFVALGVGAASAQVPAPVAPPGAGAAPSGPPGAPPMIPVKPLAGPGAVPPPPIVSPGAPQANPAAIPANLPQGAGGAPGGGLPGAVGTVINAVLAPPPAPPKREPTENEVELTRTEYRARLTSCLQFKADCSVRGLSRSDQDYMRYELKGQRITGMLLDEVLDARMLQFTSDVTVIVPKRSGNPDWHTELARGGASAAAAAHGSAMSTTESQRESGANVRTRYVPWPKQKVPDRDFGARGRSDLD